MKNIEALDDIFLHRGSNSSWANHTDLTGDWVAEKQNKTKQKTCLTVAYHPFQTIILQEP